MKDQWSVMGDVELGRCTDSVHLVGGHFSDQTEVISKYVTGVVCSQRLCIGLHRRF